MSSNIAGRDCPKNTGFAGTLMMHCACVLGETNMLVGETYLARLALDAAGNLHLTS